MKKLFAILLVVAMLLALAGCAGGETSSDNPSNNSNASVSSSDADPIRIGIWTSLTGASAIEGELIENGARLAAAQWNAKAASMAVRSISSFTTTSPPQRAQSPQPPV